jgi:hypothetical protein
MRSPAAQVRHPSGAPTLQVPQPRGSFSPTRLATRDPSDALAQQKTNSVSITVSLVVVLAVMVWLLIRKGGLKAGHAIAAVLLGFYLHDSSLAPSISRVVQSAVETISGIRI